MSVELLATLASFAGVFVAIVSGFGWIIRRMDSRIDRLDQKLSLRIDGLATHIDGVEHELVELKVSIARLEGPTPRLITAR